MGMGPARLGKRFCAIHVLLPIDGLRLWERVSAWASFVPRAYWRLLTCCWLSMAQDSGSWSQLMHAAVLLGCGCSCGKGSPSDAFTLCRTLLTVGLRLYWLSGRYRDLLPRMSMLIEWSWLWQGLGSWSGRGSRADWIGDRSF